jgi:hypothetical protein
MSDPEQPIETWMITLKADDARVLRYALQAAADHEALCATIAAPSARHQRGSDRVTRLRSWAASLADIQRRLEAAR